MQDNKFYKEVHRCVHWKLLGGRDQLRLEVKVFAKDGATEIDLKV